MKYFNILQLVTMVSLIKAFHILELVTMVTLVISFKNSRTGYHGYSDEIISTLFNWFNRGYSS